MVKPKRGGKAKAKEMVEVKPKSKRTRPDDDRAMRLQASQPFTLAGAKPYSDSHRQVWADISDDQIGEANAVRTKNFLQPGDTFEHLKAGARIEYTPALRNGSQPGAIRGTLEVIDGVRVGIHAANTKSSPYSSVGKYNLTDLYTGVTIGWGDTKADAIAHFRGHLAKNGGMTRFKRTQVLLLENMNGNGFRWSNNG